MIREQIRQKVIGVSLLTLDQPFFKEIRTGLEEEGGRCEYETIITSGEFDAAEQSMQLDNFITSKKVDAVVLAPCNSSGVGTFLEEAGRAGIPVFTVDIASTSSTGSVVSHIASDHYLGGKKAGELMIKALNGRGGVVLVSHPGLSSAMDRIRGFRDMVATAKGIQILGQFPAWGNQRSRTTEMLGNMLVKLPGLSGVFGANDDCALGALTAIEAANKGGKIAVVGYDATQEARAAIRRGLIYGCIVQYPARIGVLTMDAVRDHFAGKQIPPIISVEVGVCTAANVQQSEPS
jgi:ribose transport system substrate-binding protein